MHISKILQNSKKDILNTWMDRLKNEIPEVNNHKKSAIENSVPDLIDALVDALESDDKSKILQHSQKPGLERTKLKIYSIKHIIQEYNLLKEVIFQNLDIQTTINAAGRDAIMFTIDSAIEQAAETFYRTKQSVQVNARKLAKNKADELKLEDEHREHFIQSITHDLNNPLNNIKACINLLEGELEMEDINQILNILKQSTQQAETLIKDFLDVGTISTSEKLPVHPDRVNILQDLENEIKVYNISHKKDIELKSSLGEINVVLDVNLIRRAFNNLINNAIKHGNPSSKITVTCELDNENLSISVHNTGKPIPQEVMKTIFNRYYKIDDSGKGWGIGLAFLKKVAEAHHGELKVESTLENGNTFEIRIPAI